MLWRFITDDNVSASSGLAADDAIAQRVGAGASPPTLRLCTYRSHCALVGRFQRLESEIHLDYCRSHDIAVNRRPTGGGAIIMGENQLGVALMIPAGDEDTYGRARELMEKFSAGLVWALNQLGVQANFRRKNDIEVNGRKIAGLGIYRAGNGGLLFHASLLVDLDVPLMLRVLNTPFEKISDKEIATVAARTTTVRRERGRKFLCTTFAKKSPQATRQLSELNWLPVILPRMSFNRSRNSSARNISRPRGFFKPPTLSMPPARLKQKPPAVCWK